jgi:predicted DsbA family dithiol-disulfide isomerase
VRLRDVEESYGNHVRIHWRTFPLIPGQQPGRRTTERTQEGWQRAAAEEPRARFVPPAVGIDQPASSLPALTAIKCAERQGRDAFRRLHDRLFLAYFRDHLDIGRQEIVWRLARETGLDMTRFQRDHVAGEAHQAVLHDYAEGTAWFGVSAVPTVIFNEKVSLVGAVPEERYRSLLDWILAGEPGGLLPLVAADTSQGGATRPGLAPLEGERPFQ